MRITGINTYFKGIEKKPIKEGYEIYNDGILEKRVSYNFDSSRLLLEKFDKEGRVEEELRFFTNDGKIQDKMNYDNSGNLVKKESYNKDGKLSSETKFIYYPSGIMKASYLDFKEGGMQSETQYDDMGRKKVSATILGDNKTITKYEYDKFGNITKELSYDENGNLTYQIASIYNDNNVLTEYIEYNEENKMEKHEKYDPKTGNILRRFSLGFDSNNDSTVEVFEYDDSGKLLEEKCQEGENPVVHIKYKYDDEGNLSKKITLSEGIVLKREDFDKEGHLINVNDCASNGLPLTKRVNKFDEYGRKTGTILRNHENKLKFAKYVDYDNDMIIRLVRPYDI